MDNNDTLTLDEGTYSCRYGRCANVYRMLHIVDLPVTIKCASDAATCILNGENSKRIMDIYHGISEGTLNIRGERATFSWAA